MTPDKPELRRQMRQRRRALGVAVRQNAAKAAAQHIHKLPSWSRAQRVALYLAQDGELDTAVLAEVCRKDGKQLYLPVIDSSASMQFAAWAEDTALEINRYGIEQPNRSAERCAPENLDIAIVPLVAWDASGGRLGMGGGFYDRAFADIDRPVMLGAAFEIQQLRRIERDVWDIPLDFVLTESDLYQCHD
ncbi:MAG: 5-formyltetrahydrofolate cyclo-ligase [Pseudomonadota bacterium]